MKLEQILDAAKLRIAAKKRLFKVFLSTERAGNENP